MSLRRFAKRRDANDSAIVAAAEQMGWWMIPLDVPSDYLGWHPRHKWTPIEVKIPDGPRGGKSRNTLTAAQVVFHAEAGLRGARVLLWKTLADVIRDTEGS